MERGITSETEAKRRRDKETGEETRRAKKKPVRKYF